MMTIDEKIQRLKQNLAGMQSVLVAFSGGVDSTFLLKMAFDQLGDKVLAVTATSATYPRKELLEAQEFCLSLGAKHMIIPVDQLQVPDFANNPYDRCYLCKRHLFEHLRELSCSLDIKAVADGSNLDDRQDFRPGMQAIKELGIATPLLDAGLNKGEIRQLSQEMGLPTWNKPASACLASRFPFGEPISSARLSMIEQAEDYLRDYGFKQVRVRVHGDLARIEVGIEERNLMVSLENMDKVSKYLKELGFAFVTMDLNGYQSGCFNPQTGI